MSSGQVVRVEVSELDSEAVVSCLSANFDRALDARYAISGEFLWSAFIHPLKELQDDQVVNALMQVTTLAVTFGTTLVADSCSERPMRNQRATTLS